MGHALAVVLVIAAVDCLNPSTIAPSLYLATAPAAVRKLVSFTAGVFAVNALGGLVILLGPGQALVTLIPHPDPHARHLFELFLGLALLPLAGVLWLRRVRVADRIARSQERVDRSAFLLGAGIMAAELLTAFPYFAAIAAIAASRTSVVTEIGLLGVFNLVFVAPLLAVTAVRLLAGERGRGILTRWRADLGGRLAIALPPLVAAVAVALIIWGAVNTLTD
jgi:cytochrome c biogenesis protein CcdA